jgi:lysophospholipase L1-like esterase
VWERLAASFAESAKFDFVNAGVPGYAVSTSVRNLEHRVRQFDPDVIFIYHATNDLSFNSFELARAGGLAESRTEEELSWLSKHSLLAYLIEKNAQILFQQRQARAARETLKFTDQELVAPFKRDLEHLVRKAQEEAELVVLITFSTQLRAAQTQEQQARATQTSLYYMPYMSIEGLIRGFALYNETIRDVAREMGAVLIEAEDEIPGDPRHFVDSVHFTDAGAARMAEIVADQVLASESFRQLVEVTARPPRAGRDVP